MASTRIRYGIHQPVVNSYLVRERDRRRLRELALVVLAVMPLGGALLSYTWIHLEVLRIGYRIDQQERELHALGQDERLLRLEASHLTSPQRIAGLATKKLGMAPPRLEQMVFLTPAQLLPATSASGLDTVPLQPPTPTELPAEPLSELPPAVAAVADALPVSEPAVDVAVVATPLNARVARADSDRRPELGG